MCQEAVAPLFWYVLKTKPHQERRALEHLENQSYHVFMPTHWVKKRQVNKLYVDKEVPLFKGYLFLKGEVAMNWVAVRSTRGVASVVRFGHHYATISDQLVQQLQICKEDTVVPTDTFQPGDAVTLEDPRFKGLSATFLELCGKQRAKVLLTYAGCALCAKVPLTSLLKIST